MLTVGVGNAWGASITYTFSSKAWAASPANWSGTKDGNQFNSNGTPLGVQVCTGQSGVVATSPVTFTAVTKVEVVYSSSSKGVGTIGVQIGTNTALTAQSISKSQTKKTLTYTPVSAQTGAVKITCQCNKNSYGINSVTIFYQTAVTLNANGGAANKSATINHDATGTASFTACTRDGYICTGYYTASSGGTKILNANGTFASTNISSYITSSKWSYAAASLTLYAQWEVEAPSYTITAARNNDSYGNVSLSGTTITATPAACCEYASPAYTVSPAGSATVSQVGNAFTVTPSANTTVTINFQEKSAGKTVNFDAGAGVCATTSLTEDCDGSGVVLPNVTASGVCKGWTTFAGWRTSAIATADSTTTNPGTLYAAGSTYYPSSNGETLYAVFSKTKGGGTTPTKKTLTFGTSYARNGSDLTSVTIYTGITATATEGTTNNPKFYTSSPGTWRMYSGSELTISSSIGNITKIEFTKSSDFSLSVKSGESGTLSSETWTYASGVSSITFNVGGTTKLSAIAVTYLAPSSTTYYCSDPNCCTQLGTINGSISWTHPNEAEVSWDNLAHVSSWTVKYKVHGAGAWTTAFTDKTGLDSEITVYSDGGTNNKMKSTIATICNTAYDFLIIANPASGYCEKEETLENKNSGKWSVAYSLTGVNKSSGPEAGANVCGDYTAVFAPSSIAYALPSDVTVQIGGVTKTKDTDYTWNSSTGALSIASAKITGNLSITVTGVEVGCSADPTIGAASLSGAFGLSSVGVTVGTSSTGSAYCAWTDYGFVWGTSANPTVSDNKVQIGNSDAATTWSGNLTGSFNTGTTYYFRAYGTNSKTGAVPVYGTGNSFTPRSVTFNSNGGSAVATAYVNSGSTVSQPSAPTRTGYDFVKWQLNGADYNFSSPVNANITLDAVWSAKSYTVTFDQQSGSGGSGSVSATYDAAMPSATMPTRSGYTFGGYYGSEGGAGTQYYAADGSSAHTWDVADAKTLYAQWTAKNYTITLNNEGADSGKEGTESISVTFNANTNLTSAITKPVKDGYKFGGYYTEEDGSGTQIIDENGNVKASVASYTSATKQWIYAGDIELHALWKPSYTVTWSVNGETTTEQVVSGEQVAALPTAPTSSDCDDAKVFVGWRATAIAGVSAANPGSIFTTQAASPAITGYVTFYAVFADVSARQAITLTFPDDNSSYNGLTSGQYTSTWTAKAGTFSFTVSNFNNNNWTTWTYIKCGRKDYTSVGTITTDNAISFRVDSVYVTLDAINDSKVNSAKVYVSGTSDFATSSNIDIPQSTGVKGMKFASPATGKYYKIAFDCQSSSNGFVQISKVVFAQKSDTANYVTSCSSCDADATFTNPTPAVSGISCTAATLTATGGLATLGADGCNVSDYGFVIGTTDNPTIGGVGVNKLQVGTTNPTIGADFSYDATGLTKGTHYYIRAYATNRHGTAYSGSQNFWTKGVSSIAITTAPTKTKYVEGETFDATGMVVTATMADGSTEDVTSDCTFSPSLSTKLSDQTAVRATYSLCEVDKTADQAINVYTLTVTEGTNDTYGTAGKTDNKVTVTGLGDHKTYTVTVTSGNADKIDNGDGTYTITNATGNVTVRVDYADAVQVKVYYKVDGVTVTGLTRDVYQSETTTLPSASDLATAMTAQGMEIPDDSYPNFVGWSETEFGAQTSAPTLVTGTPTINAEKTYYAVYTNLGKKTILPANLPSSYGSDGDKDIDGVTYYRSGVAKPSSDIQFRSSGNGGTGYIYSKTSLSYILKIEVSGDNLVVNACSDASGTLDGGAITPVGTAPRVYTFPANKQYFQIKGTGSTTNHASRIDIYYASATVEYMTQFCTRYDITGVTKSGTAVTGGTLSSNYNSACEGKSVELEAVVSTGYQFNGWTIKKTDDLTQDVTSTLLGANASSLTPPAFSMPDYAITVSASITEKELTGWTWKQALPDATQIAIPSPVVLYVGQRAEFDLIEYDPSDVLAEKKGYGVTKEGTYLTQNAKADAYYKVDAKAAVESTTLTLTSTSNSSVQEVINIQIKALPSVTFEDHVHGVVFSAVAATIDEMDKRVVYLTKTTPTTSDFSGTTYNTCEEQHEHLVGWIESSWADEHPDATHSQIAGAGTGVFYTAGASIDVDAQNGKTFYAVWSKIE